MADLVRCSKAWRHLLQHNIIHPESTYTWTAMPRHHKMKSRWSGTETRETEEADLSAQGDPGVSQACWQCFVTSTCIYPSRQAQQRCLQRMFQDRTGNFPAADRNWSSTRILQQKKGAQTTELCTLPWCINTARLDGTSYVSLLGIRHN